MDKIDNAQEVFDLREFLLLMLKKSKLFIVLALVFAILGGAFGFFTANENSFVATTSASVNTNNEMTDATALTSIMTSVKDTINGDFFYTGILEAIRADMDTSEFSKLFGNSKQPSIANLKTVIRLYVNGNLVLVDVTGDEKLVLEASNIARKYVVERLLKNINSITITEQSEQVINKSLQTGDTAKSRGIKFALLGFGGGIVLAALWIFFFDVMSLKVKDKEDLKRLKLPVFITAGNDPVELQKAAIGVFSAFSKEGAGGVVIGVATTLEDNKAKLEGFCSSLCDVLTSNDISCSVKSTKGDTLQNVKAFVSDCKETAQVTFLPTGDILNDTCAMKIVSSCDGVILLESMNISRSDKIETATKNATDLSTRVASICLM